MEASMTKQLNGTKVGYLTVIERIGRNKAGRILWRCKCLCGKDTILPTYALSGVRATISCGCCEWHIHHNEAYVSWMAMKQRCNTATNKDYPRYGGGGIKYDARWENFREFYIDMGDPPKDIRTGERLSLDRKDNDGNYCKDNCKWSDRSEQQLNKG